MIRFGEFFLDALITPIAVIFLHQLVYCHLHTLIIALGFLLTVSKISSPEHKKKFTLMNIQNSPYSEIQGNLEQVKFVKTFSLKITPR
jgi:hypothetical protein